MKLLDDTNIKIIELMANDFKTKQIAEIINLSYSQTKSRIRDLKLYFQTKTQAGLMYKLISKNIISGVAE